MIIIPLILFIFLIKCWSDKKYDWMLIIITAFFTQCYGLLPESAFIIKPYDYVNVFFIISAIIGYIKDPTFFHAKKTSFVYLIYIILAYQIFEIIYTIYIGAETIPNIIKVSRISLIYLSFFTLRKIPLSAYKRFIKINLSFCIVQGCLFYLQPLIDKQILQGRIDEVVSTGQIARYANYPFFNIFYLFYCHFNVKDILKKISYFVFWGGMPILGQSRGEILVIVIAFSLYYILQNNFKHYITILISAFLISLAVIPMFQYRAQEYERSGLVEDITNIFSAEEISDIQNNGGSFTFRIALLTERWIYLIENPQYLLTGVGCIHEDSPNCYERFDFLLGTKNIDRYHGRCLIDSGDITWVPILLRYGIIGACLYLSLLIYWFIIGFQYLKRSKNSIYIVTSLLGITTTLLSVNTILFDGCFQTFFLIFCITYILKYKQRIHIVKTLLKINQ